MISTLAPYIIVYVAKVDAVRVIPSTIKHNEAKVRLKDEPDSEKTNHKKEQAWEKESILKSS